MPDQWDRVIKVHIRSYLTPAYCLFIVLHGKLLLFIVYPAIGGAWDTAKDKPLR